MELYRASVDLYRASIEPICRPDRELMCNLYRAFNRQYKYRERERTYTKLPYIYICIHIHTYIHTYL